MATELTEAAIIAIEVIYALPNQQRSVVLNVPAGTTARAAAIDARLERYFESLDSSAHALGVWGRAVEDDYILVENDRLEIYRELAISPREQRRRRESSADDLDRPRV